MAGTLPALSLSSEWAPHLASLKHIGGWGACGQAEQEATTGFLICFLSLVFREGLGYKAQLFMSSEPKQTKGAEETVLEAR